MMALQLLQVPRIFLYKAPHYIQLIFLLAQMVLFCETVNVVCFFLNRFTFKGGLLRLYDSPETSVDMLTIFFVKFVVLVRTFPESVR